MACYHSKIRLNQNLQRNFNKSKTIIPNGCLSSMIHNNKVLHKKENKRILISFC